MLSFKVTPGTRIGADDLVDASRLNLLGTPVIELEGTAVNEDLGDGIVTARVTKFESEAGSLLAAMAAHRANSRIPIRDLVSKSPVVDVRYFSAESIWDGSTDAVAAINLAFEYLVAVGGGTLLFPFGVYNLVDFSQTLGTVKCHCVLNGTATIRLLGVGGATLKTSANPGTGFKSAMITMTGALTDCAIEGLKLERGAAEVVSYPTIGLYLKDVAAAMKNVQVRHCHFRNLSRGIYGGADGVVVNTNRFSYPLGRACDGNEFNVGILAELTATQMSARWQVINNEFDGCEAASLTDSRPAWGLVRGTAMGWTIQGNRIRHAWGEAISLGHRSIASFGGLSWASAPRPCVVTGNTIDFEDVPGESARTGTGISCFEPNADIQENPIRNAHKGIKLSNPDYDPSNDAGTRMRDFNVGPNVITLASNLGLSDDGTPAINERGGILVAGFGDGKVNGNTVRFRGRTSAGVVAKYWMAAGVLLEYCDGIAVKGNNFTGPDVPLAAHLLWLTGVWLDGCRWCDVDANKYFRVNIANCAGSATSLVAPSANEFGPGRYEVNWLIWASTSMSVAENGTLTPTTLMKKFHEEGTTSRRQRVAFSALAVGWVRVAAGYKTLVGRVRVWGAGITPRVFDVAYTAGYGGAIVAVSGNAAAGLITQARVCTNNPSSDNKVHLDLYVSAITGGTVYVEFEGGGFAEGLWSEVAAPASTRTGWTGEFATLLETVTFCQGLAISGGAYNQGRVALGTRQFWIDDTGDLRVLEGTPAAHDNGVVVGTQS